MGIAVGRSRGDIAAHSTCMRTCVPVRVRDLRPGRVPRAYIHTAVKPLPTCTILRSYSRRSTHSTRHRSHSASACACALPLDSLGCARTPLPRAGETGVQLGFRARARVVCRGARSRSVREPNANSTVAAAVTPSARREVCQDTRCVCAVSVRTASMRPRLAAVLPRHTSWCMKGMATRRRFARRLHATCALTSSRQRPLPRESSTLVTRSARARGRLRPLCAHALHGRARSSLRRRETRQRRL